MYVCMYLYVCRPMYGCMYAYKVACALQKQMDRKIYKQKDRDRFSYSIVFPNKTIFQSHVNYEKQTVKILRTSLDVSYLYAS